MFVCIVHQLYKHVKPIVTVVVRLFGLSVNFPYMLLNIASTVDDLNEFSFKTKQGYY